ncbi:MAG: SulP family inorganic anion transporter [Chloroflexota bacterium]
MVLQPKTLKSRISDEWFSNIVPDLLSGLVVALALIPEAIAFSIIAGVDPKVGLYASFIIAVVTSFMGGRPAMISAATGAMALLMKPLITEYGAVAGLQYLLAASILCGVFQYIFGALKLGTYMKFVPKAVMIGFVNALAYLIFTAQFPEFTEAFATNQLLFVPFVLIGLAVIYLLPYVTTKIPSPLVALVGITVFWIFFSDEGTLMGGLRTVGDMGELPTSLPTFFIPQVPFNLETLRIILPFSLALSLVGLIESLLTAQIVDEMTDTKGDKNREMRGQGIANIITGFFGGMAGCAMIGQSIINVGSGGRTRLSTFSAGVFLLILLLVFGNFVAIIPMAALVAIMVMVSINTFDWTSIVSIRKMPITETVVMFATMLTVIVTHNLAYGVFAGVILACIFFARDLSKTSKVQSELDETGKVRNYSVKGPLYFVSTEDFVDGFDPTEEVEAVNIDLSEAQVWDASAIAAIDKVVLRYRKYGIEANVLGMNKHSQKIHDQLATHTDPNAQMSVH